MTDALKDLIERDEWASVANALKPVIDELDFRSYVHNRRMFPEIAPERWALVFRNVPAMEERYLKTFITKLMGIDVVPQGTTGVSGTVEGHGAERLKATTTSGELKQRSTGSWPSQEECIRMPLASGLTISGSPADSQGLEVAGQGKGHPSIGSLCVGNDGGGCPSYSPLYLTAYEIVDIVTKGREQ